MSTLSRLKRKWQADAGFREAYDKLKPEFTIARQLIAARTRVGLSQAEVARRMGTTQSAVARMESGQRLPGMNSLYRYANAVGYKVAVRLIHAE